MQTCSHALFAQAIFYMHAYQIPFTLKLEQQNIPGWDTWL